MNRKLYVGNLPYETNESDLETLFAEAGPVESVNVIRDRETGRVRGVLLWNVWDQVESARALIAEPGPFQAVTLKGRIA